jgi:hypothetical protein
LYANEDLGLELDNTAYALDATTIDLCLSLFPWARFHKHKGTVKMHTLLDLRGNIPTFIEITAGKVHDVNILDLIVPEASSLIAISVYVLVAIIRKQLRLPLSLYKILQILSFTLFEKTLVNQLLIEPHYASAETDS